MKETIAIIVRPFSAALDWLHMGLDALGAESLLFGVLMMLLAIRFLLMPVMGGSGSSDKARKGKREE